MIESTRQIPAQKWEELKLEDSKAKSTPIKRMSHNLKRWIE